MKTAVKFPWLYLLTAYGWAWLWTIPVAWSRQDYQASTLLFFATFIGIFGPGLAGIILTYREDREARRDFWQRAFDVRRVQMRWIIFMLLLWPALHLLANGLSKVLGSDVPVSEMIRDIANQPLILPVIVILYFLQALLEDIGWRGYMLEKVLHSWSPVNAALIVGFFHTFWHLPFFFIVGTNQIEIGFGFGFWLFVVQAVAFSIYATWCYLDNRHSTLAAVLLHTVGNLCNDLFTFQAGTGEFSLYTLFMVIGAVDISTVWLKRKGESK